MQRIKSSKLIIGYSNKEIRSYFQGFHDAIDAAIEVTNQKNPAPSIDIPIGDLHQDATNIENEILTSRAHNQG